MKKTLIASAVAAATLSTGAFAESNMPTVFGAIDVVYTNVDMDGDTTNGVDDNGSTIGFSHEHMISEGVTAFAYAEFEFDADDGSIGDAPIGTDASGNPIYADSSALDGPNSVDTLYIGVKGDFGSVIYGIDDTVYDWADVVDTGEHLGLGGGIANTKDHEFIQYASPEIADGLTFGATLPVESDAGFAGALAGKYAADNMEVVLSYAMGREEAGADQEDTLALGASFSMDEITLMGQYETTKDDQDYLALQGMYAMGQNQFALGYGMTSYDASGAEDTTEIYLQALHNLSDNFLVYLEYEMEADMGGVDGADQDTLAIGTIYSF